MFKIPIVKIKNNNVLCIIHGVKWNRTFLDNDLVILMYLIILIIIWAICWKLSQSSIRIKRVKTRSAEGALWIVSYIGRQRIYQYLQKHGKLWHWLCPIGLIISCNWTESVSNVSLKDHRHRRPEFASYESTWCQSRKMNVVLYWSLDDVKNEKPYCHRWQRFSHFLLYFPECAVAIFWRIMLWRGSCQARPYYCVCKECLVHPLSSCCKVYQFIGNYGRNQFFFSGVADHVGDWWYQNSLVHFRRISTFEALVPLSPSGL